MTARTFGEKAVDVFYVTDLTGKKVTHEPRQDAIRRRLETVLEGDVEGRSQKARSKA